MANLRRYRYQIDGAQEAGVKLHPQEDILRVAPEACEFQAVAMAGCWLFSAPPLGPDKPDYIVDVSGDTNPDVL